MTCASSPTWGSWTDRSGETSSDTATSATVAGLTNGTAYQVQVRASNSVGDGDWSASASEYPSTTPGTPAAPTLTVKDESLDVSWSAPASNGGSAITGYKVGRCDNSTGCDAASEWTTETLTGTGTSTTLTGLTNGTAYQVRVAAVNRGGDSSWSASATATPARAPSQPAAPTVTVWNKSLNISWTAPSANGAAISDYDVQYRACTQSADLTCATNPTWGFLDRPHRRDHHRHRHLGDHLRAHERHCLPGAGAGRQQRRRERLVGLDYRYPGRSEAGCSGSADACGQEREPRCVVDRT